MAVVLDPEIIKTELVRRLHSLTPDDLEQYYRVDAETTRKLKER